MWACALGHQAAAEVLYGWNSQALGIPDSLGRLPLAVARSRGHTCLARALEDLHTHRPDTHTPTERAEEGAQGEQSTTPQLPPSPLSTSPDTAHTHLIAFSFCPQVDMATLAEQIIEATPERIKQEELSRGAESPLRERRDNTVISDTMPWLATYLDTHTHSSLSRCVYPPDHILSPSLLNADLILSVQGRRLKEQQDMAAAVIQRCYRKYKQLTWIALKYALYKRMTQAAILIQSKFRSYYEQKKFQQSRRAAVLIQQYYRSYKEYERLKQGPRGSGSHNPKLK
nr:calmodulin-binding transcription activator 2-like [Oncorhynchus nerka]